MNRHLLTTRTKTSSGVSATLESCTRVVSAWKRHDLKIVLEGMEIEAIELMVGAVWKAQAPLFTADSNEEAK